MKRTIAILAAFFALATLPAGALAQEANETIASPQGPASDRDVEARIQALMQRAMMRCWRMPIDQPNPERLMVTVAFELNEDGTLHGRPRVVYPEDYLFDRPMRVAVTRALRAVRDCSPYPFAIDPITAGHYEVWGKLEFTFRAR